MAMTNQKILDAVRDLHGVLMLRGVRPVRFSEREQLQKMTQLSTSAIRGHLAFVCEEIPRLLEDGRREKVMRWLGWLQGATWALNYASLDSLKNMNKPEGER